MVLGAEGVVRGGGMGGERSPVAGLKACGGVFVYRWGEGLCGRREEEGCRAGRKEAGG